MTNPSEKDIRMDSPAKARPSITPTVNGPYLVRGLQDLSNQKGPLETKPTTALCRCGGSANKPFCDGTHAKISFSSAKLEGRTEDKRVNYEGEDITIHDNRGICAHSGRCTDALPPVFRLGQEPWIDPKAASRETIMATIRTCPSGALSYSVDGVEYQGGEKEPAIFVSSNGPYVVTGGPEVLETVLGDGASSDRLTLCRCGGSKNKPFCDGTHWHLGFNDDNN
ncbi:MAG: CDGSH iron-sulfur domain-containing protein [Acidobacteria bacterium]|nr:CDGSH iron-sulfur domain-containing protein [Acidobacteriota bacterium]